jgi:3-phosphoshikimate 1-carboxyvinyltransferase
MAAKVLRLLVKQAVDPLEGAFEVPCSKYHAHRALIMASLTEGTTRIHGLSDAGHVRHTISALRRLGTKIDVRGDTFVVEGGPYHPKGEEVSVGSSGTTLYFLTGLLSLSDAPVTVVAQKYLRRRPIGPLLEALAGLGVELSSPNACPPIRVEPRRPRGGKVSIAGTLSQWISGLVLLAPFASGPSVVSVEGPFNERSYVELTVRMMREFGLDVEVSPDGRRFEIEGGQRPRPATLTLPPDVGAAAFGLAVTALHPSDVLFGGLPALSGAETDHPESELLDVVRAMGLPMSRDPRTGMVRVRHDGVRLEPTEVDCRRVPDMLPVLSVLGTFAKGTTVLDHVAHVRLKESDRVAAMLQLNRMGGRLEQRGDRLVCQGVDHLHGADLSSFNDHRVLMALAVAGSRAEGETRLTYPNAYRISYPRFLEEMTAVGVPMAVESPAGVGRSARDAAGERARARRRADNSAHEAAFEATSVPIGDHVRRWAAERPADPAVVQVSEGAGGDHVVTWGELDHVADALATFLLERGVAPGDPVAYQLPNCSELVVVTLAAARVGAVCCPIMPIFREREVTLALQRSRARVLVVPGGFRGRDYVAETSSTLSQARLAGLQVRDVVVVGAAGALARVPGPGSSTPSGARRGPTWHRFEAVAEGAVDRRLVEGRAPDPRAVVQLLFTSGTSGEPKGVLHRMDSLTRAAVMEARHLGLGGSDRIFVPSPMAHQTGFLYGMWLALVLGVPQVVQPVWDGDVALAAMRRWGTTFVQAATPFLVDLVEAVERTGERPGSLRVFVVTGAGVPRGLAERATRVLGTAVCGAWGTTETCLGSLSGPDDDPAMLWGTDGRALQGVRLRVTDGRGAELARGEEGHLEVSTDCLFTGYLDRPDLTAEALTPDGWYRTGDLAVIDESGYVRISGRTKDVVNRGGEKVPVAEIEELLHAHPAVGDVAIVAMPDERLGERACAFVVTTPRSGGLDLTEVQRFLDGHRVARQYWPERLEVVDRLPRTPSGKVQKYVLRERARQLVAGEGDGGEDPSARA